MDSDVVGDLVAPSFYPCLMQQKHTPLLMILDCFGLRWGDRSQGSMRSSSHPAIDGPLTLTLDLYPVQTPQGAVQIRLILIVSLLNSE